jgi:hypothetical protein
VTAVLLKLDMALAMLRPSHFHANLREGVILRAVLSVSAILKAAGFVGCGLLVIARSRDRSGHLQPGHWILRAEAPVDAWATLCSIVLGLAAWSHSHILARESARALVIAMMALPALWRAAIYFAASRLTADGRRWRMLFLSLAILAICPAWWLLMGMLAEGGPGTRLSENVVITLVVAQLAYDVLVYLAFLGIAAADLRNRRDWLHWLGIVLGAFGTVSSAMPLLPFFWIAMLTGM